MSRQQERHAVLRRLWLRAGSPKIAAVARRARVSENTARRALSGTADTLWPNAMRLILVLGGEPEDYRPLWIDPVIPRQRTVHDALTAISELAGEINDLRQEVAELRKEVSG